MDRIGWGTDTCRGCKIDERSICHERVFGAKAVQWTQCLVRILFSLHRTDTSNEKCYESECDLREEVRKALAKLSLLG